MSYEPTEWQAGDIVTSAKLNKMEQGIAAGGGVLVVNKMYDEDTGTYTLNKTWKEIHDADFAVIKEIAGGYEDGNSTVYEDVGFRIIANIAHIDDAYYVSAEGNDFETDSETGYPCLT